MTGTRFIQVLLPLKLDWEPYYVLPEGTQAQVGDAVEVNLAGHRYTGIVTAVDVIPADGLDIKPANELSPLASIVKDVLTFWRTLADYYLCTTGEVYKAAAQQARIKPQKPKKKADAKEVSATAGLTPEQATALDQVKAAFAAGKTVLLQGSGREEIYRKLEQETAAKCKSFLHLTPATKRLLLEPVKNLGLVVVDQEHDASYKQDSPAPRFNARDAAIMLANLHGANVILGSDTPSLESLYNAETGLFTKVELKQSSQKDATLINTSAEARKNGMSGSFSFKLLEAMKSTLEAGKKVLLVCRSKQAVPEAVEELKILFPEAPEKAIVTASPLTLRTQDPAGFGLVAFLQADSLLGKEDFRSDERALQTLRHLASKTPLAIQTREPGHPVFKALLEGRDGLTFIEERRLCGLPPFTRLVNLVIRDYSEKRINFLSEQLADQIRRSAPANDGMVVGPYIPSYQQEGEYIRIIRVTLARDKTLKSRKAHIYQTVKDFEKQYKYTGHIVIDVDPV